MITTKTWYDISFDYKREKRCRYQEEIKPTLLIFVEFLPGKSSFFRVQLSPDINKIILLNLLIQRFPGLWVISMEVVFGVFYSLFPPILKVFSIFRFAFPLPSAQLIKLLIQLISKLRKRCLLNTSWRQTNLH